MCIQNLEKRHPANSLAAKSNKPHPDEGESMNNEQGFRAFVLVSHRLVRANLAHITSWFTRTGFQSVQSLLVAEAPRRVLL